MGNGLVLINKIQMFSNRGQTDAQYDTSALPGGRKPSSLSSSPQIPWREFIQTPLPPQRSLEKLVDSYFGAVDWFMMVKCLESSVSF